MPRIATTLCAHDTPRCAVARKLYLDAIAAAGGDPIPVYPGDKPTGRIDGLFLTGGEDIDPARYGEAHDGSEAIDQPRDELEFALLATALADDLAVLGVCRGLQVLNVHFGGSLVQHVVGHRAKEMGIPDDPAGPDAVRHAVSVAPGSRLAAACGTRFTVNSSHHQVVTPERLAPRVLRPTVQYDGIVEAVESADHRWVVGVQWHPERAQQVDEAAVRIFDAFVREARPA